MGRIWNSIRAAASKKWKEDKKEVREVLGALRGRKVPEVIKDKWYGDIRATGRFGRDYLGEEPRYDTEILSALSPDFYVASKGRRLEDYTFEVAPPFQIPVYAKKGMQLQDAVAIALKELTDKDKIPNLEDLANRGIVEKILYQASGGQDVAAEAGIGYSLRSIFASARNDLSRTGAVKPTKGPEAKATGKGYMVTITPMILKDVSGYAGGSTGPTGASIPLTFDPSSGYHIPSGGPGSP
ncbi:hypothetical protein HYV80_06275 [Candidatus Woesearchaeota archaeon]|nr:hypothetical protein [Candidatus Woesearchaeota archaeon]